MISPTVGRVVLYHPPESERIAGQPNDQPLDAHVTYVWSDRLINIMAVTPNGVPYGATSVVLIQDDDPRPPGRFCEWMQYQKGQAAKYEALEAKAKST